MFDLLLKNGKVVFEDAVKVADIAVNDGIISKIGANSGAGAKGKAREIIDCTNLHILAGVIDCHTHIRTPGLTQKEDFKTGSAACAAGGITTFLDMPNTVPPTTTLEALNYKRSFAKEDSIVNFGFFFGATEENLDEIKRTKDIAGIKVYFGADYKDLSFKNEAALDALFKWGKRIIAVHCESPSGPYEAVKKALHIAKKYDAKIHIVHVSTREEVEEIKKFKTDKVTCEVTPHHLFLNLRECLELGNFAKTNPPLVTRENQDALWQGIDNNVIEMIASDHAPHTKGEKSGSDAPPGVPGVETMLPLMLNAVNSERIDIVKVSKLLSANPSRIFGIKNKGLVAEGFDADLVIVDMYEKHTVRDDKLFTKCGWSPFNGMELTGVPKITIVNGKKIFENGKIVAGDFRGSEVEFE